MKLLKTISDSIAARNAKMISTTATTTMHVVSRIRRFVIRTLFVVGTIIVLLFAMLITIGIVFPPSPESIARMENAREERAERREAASRVWVGSGSRTKRGGPVHVDGYKRKDGTYVKSYNRSAPTN
jgi:hypothetical protein